MNISPLKTLAVVAAMATAATATNAAESITFAQFFQQSTIKELSYKGALPTTVMAAAVPVDLTSLAFGPLGVFSDAIFDFSATTNNNPTVVGSLVNQIGFGGSLTIIGTGDLNYLTIDFVDAIFTTTVGGRSGSFIASAPTSTVTVTSDFFDISNVNVDNFSLSFSGFSQVYKPGVDFVSNVSGTFAGAVPEPATWALMIAGFGMVGFAARRRRVQQVLS